VRERIRAAVIPAMGSPTPAKHLLIDNMPPHKSGRH
jgi:hypothetical protein